MIILQQIERIINKLTSNKASELDNIINRVLKKTLSIIQHHLLALMQTSFDNDHFLIIFKTITIVILRKSDKLDYIKSNTYRSIVLKNTLEKIMKSIITNLISYIIELHELLFA